MRDILYDAEVGRRFEILRHKAQLPGEAVAKYLGISYSSYFHYERGATVSVKRLRQIAKLYGITVDHILGEAVFTQADIDNIIGAGERNGVSRRKKPLTKKEKRK